MHFRLVVNCMVCYSIRLYCKIQRILLLTTVYHIVIHYLFMKLIFHELAIKRIFNFMLLCLQIFQIFCVYLHDIESVLVTSYVAID